MNFVLGRYMQYGWIDKIFQWIKYINTKTSKKATWNNKLQIWRHGFPPKMPHSPCFKILQLALTNLFEKVPQVKFECVTTLSCLKIHQVKKFFWYVKIYRKLVLSFSSDQISVCNFTRCITKQWGRFPFIQLAWNTLFVIPY